MKRVIIPLLLTSITVCACKSDIKATLHKSVAEREPVSVKVLECSDLAGTGKICYVGMVETSRQVTLTSPAPATVEKICFGKGAKVRKGDVIAKLSSASVQSVFDVASANLKYAEDGLARAEQVYESGAVAESKMVEIRSQVDKARASYNAALNSLNELEIKAPYNGTIGELPISEGVKVSLGEQLVRFIDADAVEVRFSVPENEYASVSIGEIAEIEVPAAGKRTKAAISVKGVQASRLSHSYECVICNIPDASDLVPGMVCKVYLTKEDGSGIVIPAGAVMTDADGRFVWTVEDGIVGKKHVVIDGYSGKGVIVGQGLSADDAVIIEGSRKVSSGMKVKVTL